MPNVLDSLRNGKVRAVVNCCVAETTLTFVRERKLSDDDFRRKYLGPYTCEARELAEHDGTLPEETWDWYDGDEEEKPGHKPNGRATYEAIRIKKVRLRRNSYVIVSLHGDRVRWLTITVRENVKDKKEFLYMVENLRKELHRNGFTLKYSGMIERQERGAWHLHCLAYLLEDDWDYKAMQAIAVGRGMNIDFQKLRTKCDRASKACAAYMSKLDAVVIAAYESKMETGEDYVYTLTSKHCDLPRRKVLTYLDGVAFLEAYWFHKYIYDIGGGVTRGYYRCDNEEQGRDIYDSC